LIYILVLGLRNQFELSENTVILLEVEIEEKNTALNQNSVEIRDFHKTNSSLQSHLAAITQELNFYRMKVLTLNEEIVLKNENEVNLNLRLKTAEENERYAERRLQVVGAAFHTDKSEENNGNRDSRNTILESKSNEKSDEGNVSIYYICMEVDCEIRDLEYNKNKDNM
jgi:chromosome segregation ATPase